MIKRVNLIKITLGFARICLICTYLAQTLLASFGRRGVYECKTTDGHEVSFPPWWALLNIHQPDGRHKGIYLNY
jgi:hypothetical protein